MRWRRRGRGSRSLHPSELQVSVALHTGRVALGRRVGAREADWGALRPFIHYVFSMSRDFDREPRRLVAPEEECPATRIRLADAATRNLAVAMSLRMTAWQLVAAGIRTFRPGLTEAEVEVEVRAQFRRSTG